MPSRPTEPCPPFSAPGTSRRDFLSRTAALAGAGAVLGALPTRADARELPQHAPRVPVGEGETIRMGVIGVGGMGGGHCDRIMALAAEGREDVQIVAVSDVCDERRLRWQEACSERQGIEVDEYVDYHDLLDRDDIHCVLTATPEHWHAKVVEDAVAHGKDVYCEKPMTLRLREALRLRELMIANPDMIVQIGTQYMMLEKYQVAKKLVAEGAIGKPVFSQTSYCRNSKDGEWLYYPINPEWKPGVNLDWRRWCGPLGPQPWDPEVFARWRRYRKYSTGIIGDLLVHVMTPLVMALDQGWPARVVATGGHYVDKAMENHDQVNIQVQFEKGHTMIVAGSTVNEKGLETMIRGHQATLYLGGKDVVLRPERHWVDEIEEQTITCQSIAEQDELRLDWLRSVRTREPNRSPVELATQVMVIVDLATRSMWEGHAFEFDSTRMEAHRI